MTKLYQAICVISLLGIIVIGFMYSYEKNQAEKYKSKWQESELKVDNLEKRIQANVAADKKKAELEKKMSSSKDIDNLNHVPDVDILNQLRSSPL